MKTRIAQYIVRLSLRTGRWRLGLTVSALAASALLPAAQLWCLSRLVAGVAQRGEWSRIAPFVLALALLLGTEGLLRQAQQVLASAFQGALHDEARIDLMAAVARVPVSNLENAAFMDEARAARESLQSGRIYIFASGVLYFFSMLVGIIGVGALLWRVSPVATLLVVLSSTPAIFIGYRRGATESRLSGEVAATQRRADYLEQLLTTRESALELGVFGKRQWAVSRARILLDLARKPMESAEFKNALWALPGAVVEVSILLLALWIMFRQSQDLSVGDAAILVGAIGTLASLSTASEAAAMIFQQLPVISRFSSFVLGSLEPPALPVTDDAATADVVRNVRRAISRGHGLVARNLSFDYPSGTRGITDVSLEARPGELLAICGPSGAGKTTLVKSLLGLLQAQGSVRIGDVDLLTLPEDQRFSLFATLLQDYTRYKLPAIDALTLTDDVGQDDDAMARVRKSVAMVEAESVIDGLPHGLSTQLGEEMPRGVGLSGGQWQRIALAHVYFADAPVWILDEPTSAIDVETELQVFQQLRAALGNDTIGIVVTHRLWSVKAAQQVIVIDDGRIVETGHPETLLTTPDSRFARLFAHQQA